jgi:hypothetical protein
VPHELCSSPSLKKSSPSTVCCLPFSLCLARECYTSDTQGSLDCLPRPYWMHLPTAHLLAPVSDMTDTTSIQAWETIETTDAITSEQYSSVVESFTSHYQKFLGYQPGEEELWWSSAAGGQFSEESKQPFWSHPLAKTGILGASGLAATLLVGVALSETVNDKPPSFTFREPTPPSSFGLSKAQSAETMVPQSGVSPAAPSVEFSGNQSNTRSNSSDVKAGELPAVEIPQLIESPGRWNLPNRPALSEDTGLTARISRPTVSNSPLPAATMPAPQPQPQAVRPSPDLAQSSSDRTRLTPATVADASRSPMLGVLDRLPMLEEADPQEMEEGGNTAVNPSDDAPVAPTRGTSSPSNNQALYPGEEALPLPAQPPLPSNPVDGSDIDVRQDKISFEQLPMLAIAEPTPTSSGAATPEPSPFPMQPSVEFERPNGTERILSDRSLTFSQQTAATSDVLTYYPVFEATVQSAVQLAAIAATQPDRDTQSSTVAAAVPSQGTSSNATKAAPTLNSLRDFLNYKRLPSGYMARVMPLSRQAATEVQQSDTVDQFRIVQLSPREYQTAWVIRNGPAARQTPTPTYGFIDYQRQMIVVPNVS